MTFSDICALFPAQNFKTKVLTAQKNLLLECPAASSIGAAGLTGDPGGKFQSAV